VIEIENEVFTTIKTALTGISALSAENENPNNIFPITTMREIDNTPYEPTQDSDSVENHTSWACQFDAYSNLISGKKAQCKAIMKVIDEAMADMGFTRFALETIENAPNITIHRMVSRYRGIIDIANKSVYRR